MTKTVSCTLALLLALVIGGGSALGQDTPTKDTSGSQTPAKDAKKKPGNMYENLFKKLDANDDGILTREEYFAFFKKKDSAQLESSWKKMDPDGTGKVTLDYSPSRSGRIAPAKRRVTKRVGSWYWSVVNGQRLVVSGPLASPKPPAISLPPLVFPL